jgi:ATP phosphoribosyltransferase regulatory subunit
MLFGLFGGFFDSPKQFEEAKKYAAGYDKILGSLNYLTSLHEVLKHYEVEHYVSYELGSLSDYHYYTGIIFSGYTFGTGEPIVKGGRYDNLLKYFGKDAPAIGFAVVVDQLLAALSRQKAEPYVKQNCQLLVYRAAFREEAISQARAKRNAGSYVQLQKFDETKSKTDYEAYAERMNMSEIIWIGGE